jgi:hypothetical protein
VTPARPSPARAVWRPWTIAATLGLTAVGALALHLMGRRLWCACGSSSPWAWDIWSAHNSQHVIDPYTFTHVLHGALFYALLWLLVRGRAPALRALLAVAVEGESTIALNYYGDSIVNSVADVAAFVVGYVLAMTLPTLVSVAGFVAVEAALLLFIRDSLMLNVLMLVHPIQAIKTWQLGG